MNQTIIKTIFLLVVAVCVGIAVYYFNQDDLSELLSLIAAITVTVLGALVQIMWPNRGEAVSNNPKTKSTKGLFYDFQKPYFEFIRFQNRDFDIKGFSTQTIHTLDLERVFVELRLQPQPPHLTAVDPIRKFTTELNGSNFSVWKFLQLMQKSQINPKVVIIGPPGSGKTTLLRYMALIFSSPMKIRRNITSESRIPILVYLRDHSKNIFSNPNIHLPELVEQSLSRWDITAPKDWFLSKLKRGRCIVMLDGLDEVADKKARQRVSLWVETQMKAYPSNIFILTSRPHGYRDNPITGVSVLEVMEFDREQINKFIHNWYLANEIKSHVFDDMGVQMAAKSGAEDLLFRLENTPNLMDLAVNPLLLTMIATVHRYRSSLPGRRVELYKEIFEVFLGKRQESKGLVVEITPAQRLSVLQPLAYEMMYQKTREIKINEAVEIIKKPLSLVSSELKPVEFLKDLENQSGLFLERESGIFGFAHKTFQEYLASMYFLEGGFENELVCYIDDDWWHETIRLYAAQTDASNIILACISEQNPSSLAISLAIHCSEEGRLVSPEVREKLEQKLNSEAESADQTKRVLIAEAILAHRIKSMTLITPELGIDTKLLSNAEYQLFVDDMLWRGFETFPPQWKNRHFAPGTASNPVVGVTYPNAVSFCKWLNENSLYKNEYKFRLPRLSEVKKSQYAEFSGFWLEVDRGWKCWSGTNGWPKLSDKNYQSIVETDIRDTLNAIFAQRGSVFDSNSYLVTVNRSIHLLMDNKSDLEKMLKDSGNRLLKKLMRMNTERALSFAPLVPHELKIYDPSVSTILNQESNHHLENAVIESMHLLSEYFENFSPNTDRLVLLYLATMFTFFTCWLDRPLKLVPYSGLDSFDKRVDFILDQYVDMVILKARQSGLVPAFEGILLVKEKKK